MVKLVKGNNRSSFIKGEDVTTTKGAKNPGLPKTVDDALDEVDETLDEHKKEIDRLKSNLKYVYSYGGVGGKGSGGSGGGSQVLEPKLYVSIDGHPIEAGSNNVIYLNKPDTYIIEGTVSNGGGELYYVYVDLAERINTSNKIILSPESENRYSFTKNITLTGNGDVVIRFFKNDNMTRVTQDVRQTIIVTPHTFDVKFKYQYLDDMGQTKEGLFVQPYEYFMGDSTHLNPFIDAEYEINRTGATNISISYKIGDTDINDDEEHSGQGIKNYGEVTNNKGNHFIKEIHNLTKDGEPFIDDKNTGIFNTKITLQYTVNGRQETDSVEFPISLIPNYLYINVRNPQNLIYDSLNELIDDEVSEIPRRNITVGAYTQFFCKVYEKEMRTLPEHYELKLEIYDEYDGSEDRDDPFNDNPTRVINKQDLAEEQKETPIPFHVAFDTPGIKKLVFSTIGRKTSDHSSERPVVKYIYVKPLDTSIIWYPSNVEQKTFYFRANSGFSDNFPQEPFDGTSPLELSQNLQPITLTDREWGSPSRDQHTTILSLGIQYSAVNKDHAQILSTYTMNEDGTFQSDPDVVLYSDNIFDKKICVPYESGYNKAVNSQYHLLQIVRHRIDFDENTQRNEYATYLYIDGKIEASKTTTDGTKLHIGKIVLNNVNVVYNLINLQYLKLELPSSSKDNHIMVKNTNTIDRMVYQYYLAYKQLMGVGEVTNAERELLNYINDIKFDGEDVIVNKNFVSNVSKFMPIPTMMMEYPGTDESMLSEFTRKLFKGYKDGDNEKFETAVVNFYWSTGSVEGSLNPNLLQVHEPNIYDNNNHHFYGDWIVDLQGTSTMRNRIKNFSFGVRTKDFDGTNILISPNYSPTNPHTFLPEKIWTLKADVADSSHASNTSVGKFINTFCTPFIQNNGQSLRNDIKPYIKNTLEGFPVLMYFKIGSSEEAKVYYLGVYNFNMGRQSYYNLGYNTNENTTYMVDNIQVLKDASEQNDTPFSISVGYDSTVSDIVIAEVQENNPEFDFHQYDREVLFSSSGSGTSSMFGDPESDKITGKSEIATSALQTFVKSVAQAGAYCFANIGKETVPSEDANGACVKRYNAVPYIDPVTGRTKYHEIVPDIGRQFTYIDKNKVWYDVTDPQMTYEGIRNDVEMLLKCIYETKDDGVSPHDQNYHNLDYTSASEYYTVCMAFGLVDSILKNMNVKSWDAKKFFIAFYDMDCAFGIDNKGEETITYLAATDYWHSEVKDGYLQQVTVNYDYWDISRGFGFDFTSSYLFAIAKYAYPILAKRGLGGLINYPQQFWGTLRKPGGPLENANIFIQNYFSSGIGQIPSYMASLDYQVKYLYKGEYLTQNGSTQTVQTGYLANSNAFNGTRIEKVRDWMNRRLHFLDVVFNVQGIDFPIGGGYNLPKADRETLGALSDNPDVIILTDMFSTEDKSNAIMESPNTPIDVYAPKSTPCIIHIGQNSDEIYILDAEIGEPNRLNINVRSSQSCRVFGSKEFTNLSSVEPLLTNAEMISSNNIEEIKYGGRTDLANRLVSFSIYSTSVKNIQFNIPAFKGTLNIPYIDSNGNPLSQALNKLNVSDSGLYGEWTNLSNLQELNISSVNNKDGIITLSGCPLLTGEKCIISGKDEKPTTLKALRIANVSGKFTIKNTRIEEMQLTISKDDGMSGEVEIDGDLLLNKLTLSGFKKIVIRNCPNLKDLKIEYPEKCEEFILDIPEYENRTYFLHGLNNEYDLTSNPKYVRNIDEDVFDFTKFVNLNTFGLSGTVAKVIKMPDKPVSIVTMMNNKNLVFVDTAGKDSVLVLTDHSTFYNCPCYCMRQSWWSIDGNNIIDITETRSNPRVGIYTKMCISEDCTTLANTFDRPFVASSETYMYDSSNTAPYYTNIWGQKVYNKDITINEAELFINKYVGGKPIEDAYIDEDGFIHDTSGKPRSFGVDRQGNIESLRGCFRNLKGIMYKGSPSVTVPNLSEYTALTDISQMYSGTDVRRITAELLSLPFELNNNDGPELAWGEFVKNGEIDVSKDAFKNISYRITGLAIMQLTIYDIGSNYNRDPINITTPTDDSEWFNIVSILCPHKKDGSNIEYSGNNVTVTFNPNDSLDTYELFTRIRSFTSFSVNSSQWIDYRDLMKFCPSVRLLTGFLNSDLSKARLDGMLKTCKNLTGIQDSFNHTGNVDDLEPIDLYEFFNWGDPSLFGIQSLFTSSLPLNVGFSIKKQISAANFETIINMLHNYSTMSSLSNIFSYCTINGYITDFEIKLEETMNNIRNINALFYKCKTDNGSPLRIRRSFFEHLPNVISMANTFVDVYFDKMFSYDFFCKRIDPENNAPRESDIFVNIGTEGSPEYKPAKLYETGYNVSSLITNMYNCFCGAKFKNCKCWFDPNDDVNENLGLKPNKVIYNGEEYQSYYVLNGGVYTKYEITEPVAKTDTINNFTNYVPTVYSNIRTEMRIKNHDIWTDMGDFGNTRDEYPYSVPLTENGTEINIYPTYCCLPPDILHCCHYQCNLTSVFADTNIIGVIPQHLLIKCYNSTLNNMLRNVNVLPNLLYHYDSNTAGDLNYLNLIQSIPIDNDTIMERSISDNIVCVLEGTDTDDDLATVLFRNSNGELRRRRPVAYTYDESDSEHTPVYDNYQYMDYNKSQFVYVPQGYTTNQKLEEAFTFRYNLPQQVDLISSLLPKPWPESTNNYYSDAYSPDNRPDLWPYYTQYFFTVNDSVEWRSIYNMKNPFITDYQDRDFKTDTARLFYTSEETLNTNIWWVNRVGGDMKSTWIAQTEDIMNVFLNLCGNRDKRTGRMTDIGCMISLSINANNYPKLDCFVNGIITTFLNGKIFDNLDAARFSIPLYAESNNIIIYSNGFGRNIIFPLLNAVPANLSEASRVLLSHNADYSMFYPYMFPTASLSNYMTIFNISSVSNKNINLSKTYKYYIVQTS